MALTVKQYAIRLWDVRKSVSQKLGTDITTADISTRANALSSDVVTAVILKLLVEKAVFTDAELNQASNAVINANFAQLQPSIPSSMDGAPVPDPDLGA